MFKIIVIIDSICSTLSITIMTVNLAIIIFQILNKINIMINYNYKLPTDIILSNNIIMTHSHIDDIDNHQSIVFIIIRLLYIFLSINHFFFFFIESFISLLQSEIILKKYKEQIKNFTVLKKSFLLLNRCSSLL